MPETQIFHALARDKFPKPDKTYNEKLAELPKKLGEIEKRDKLGLLINLIKNNLPNYVIQELPESYINLQQKIALEQGHGNIEVTEELKENWLEIEQKNQLTQLETWFKYILETPTNIYPSWYKYLVLRSVIGLNKDGEKRSKDRVGRFLPLNQAVVAKVYSGYTKLNENGEEVLDENGNPIFVKGLKYLEEKEVIKQGEIPNFGNTYMKILRNQENFRTEFTPEEIAEGQWQIFEQTNDEEKVKELSDLASKTCWCIAGIETARNYLGNGDFHIFMVGNIPAIAIRMQNDEVAEVRGTKPNQNLGANLAEVLQPKLKELPGGESYEKKDRDMKLLTQIYYKNQKGEELTKEEIIFLYEIEEEIEGFGYEKDPRIEEVRKSLLESGKLVQFLEEVGSTKLETTQGIAYIYIPKNGKKILSFDIIENEIFIKKKDKYDRSEGLDLFLQQITALKEGRTRNTRFKEAEIENLERVSIEIIKQLVEENPDDTSLLANIARYYKLTPSSVLSELAKNQNLHVRISVAEHHNTSSETLALLATDENGKVRKAVAANPNTVK